MLFYIVSLALQRAYYDYFGLHPDLWKFCRKLRDLQEYQENEELIYLRGGIAPTVMSAVNRKKEQALYTLRELFVASDQSVEDGYKYVESISFRMRRYNLASTELDFDDII